MKLTKWKLKDKVYSFPSNWTKDRVLAFANTDIRVCPICSKVDVGLDHFDTCNPQQESIRQQRIQDYYD
jgi:hypothetical protein